MSQETKSEQPLGAVVKDGGELPTTSEGDTVIGGKQGVVEISAARDDSADEVPVSVTREGCEAMLSALQDEISQLDQEILRLTRLRDAVSGEIDQTRKMIEKEFPPPSAAEVYQKFIESQQRQRAEQTALAREAAAMLPGRVSAKSGASPLDRALSGRPRDPLLVQPLRGG